MSLVVSRFLFSLLAVPAGALDTDLINLHTFDFSIRQDIRYASANNFAKKVIYDQAVCVLRRPVAEALARVQARVKLQQMSLKVFECYRPVSMQKKLAELAKGQKGPVDPVTSDRHHRGAAVDLTLVDATDVDLEMPSRFDDYSDRSARCSAKATKRQKKNSLLLEKAMVAEGFVPLASEWWHFDYQGWESFPAADEPLSQFP